jgi:hypothetical protein
MAQTDPFRRLNATDSGLLTSGALVFERGWLSNQEGDSKPSPHGILQRRKQRAIADLFGTVDFLPDFDHKKLRANR